MLEVLPKRLQKGKVRESTHRWYFLVMESVNSESSIHVCLSIWAVNITLVDDIIFSWDNKPSNVAKKQFRMLSGRKIPTSFKLVASHYGTSVCHCCKQIYVNMCDAHLLALRRLWKILTGLYNQNLLLSFSLEITRVI